MRSPRQALMARGHVRLDGSRSSAEIGKELQRDHLKRERAARGVIVGELLGELGIDGHNLWSHRARDVAAYDKEDFVSIAPNAFVVLDDPNRFCVEASAAPRPEPAARRVKVPGRAIGQLKIRPPRTRRANPHTAVGTPILALTTACKERCNGELPKDRSPGDEHCHRNSVAPPETSA